MRQLKIQSECWTKKVDDCAQNNGYKEVKPILKSRRDRKRNVRDKQVVVRQDEVTAGRTYLEKII